MIAYVERVIATHTRDGHGRETEEEELIDPAHDNSEDEANRP